MRPQHPRAGRSGVRRASSFFARFTSPRRSIPSPDLRVELLEERRLLDAGLGRLGALGADPAAFVTNLYDRVLSRPADDTGTAYWAGRLTAGDSAAQVAAQFLASEELLSQTTDGWLDGVYHTVLDRHADDAGQAYWDGLLGQGVSRADVAWSILTSPEAQALGQSLLTTQAGPLPLLVQLRGDVPDALDLLNQAAGPEGATVADTGTPGLYRLTGDATALDRLKASLTGAGFVQYVETDQLVTLLQSPNDPSLSNLWGLTGSRGIQAPTAWDVGTGSTNTTVAIIDTGIDYNHPDLYLNIWLNQGEIPASRRINLVDTDSDGLITFWDLNNPVNQGVGKITDLNGDRRITAADILAPMAKNASGADTGQGGWANGVSDDGDGYRDDFVGWNFVNNTNNPMDDHNHGTHVAGTIGAVGNNGVGVAGITWKTQMMAIKFLGANGSGSTSAAGSGLRYAVDHGARVSNNSYGGGSDTTLYNAINYANTKGHVFVAAAGNNGRNIDSSPTYPASYNLSNIISVAAIDSAGNKASFSNYGATSVDLGAPGVSILSTVRNGGYSYFNGTSMATPHVAGVATLLFSLYPTWTGQQVKDRILTTVTPMASMAGRTVTGGILNGWEAVRNRVIDWTGWNTLGNPAQSAAWATLPDGSRQLFNLGTDSSLSVRTQAPDGTWGAMTNLGGLGKQLTLARNASGATDAFVIGFDDALWMRPQTAPGVFGDWVKLGGTVKAIAAGTRADGRQQVFAIFNDNSLRVLTRDAAGNWGAWVNLLGQCKQVTVTRNAQGNLDVYVIGFDDHLWGRSQTAPGTFSAWADLGGLCKQIVAATGSDGREQVFVIGFDNGLWTRRQNADGSFGAWTNLGGTIRQVSAVANANGTVDAVVVGFDDKVWVHPQTASGVYGPRLDLRGGVRGLAVGVGADGRAQVAATSVTDNGLWVRGQSVPGLWA